MQGFAAIHGLHRTRSPGAAYVMPQGAPPQLATLLTTMGGKRYAEGFWNFAPARTLAPHLSPWGLAADSCVPFLKAAFGHIVFVQGGLCKVVNPVFNAVDVLGEVADLGFVLDVLLCDRPALESSFLIDLYEATWATLGEPDDDEIYALVPALGLGGPREASHVQRRPMGPEMQLLSQL
jgi:hypothetical protein